MKMEDGNAASSAALLDLLVDIFVIWGWLGLVRGTNFSAILPTFQRERKDPKPRTGAAAGLMETGGTSFCGYIGCRLEPGD